MVNLSFAEKEKLEYFFASIINERAEKDEYCCIGIHINNDLEQFYFMYILSTHISFSFFSFFAKLETLERGPYKLRHNKLSQEFNRIQDLMMED